MNNIKKLIMLVGLVVIFTLGTMLSPLMLLFRPTNVFKAMNRLCGAAYLGFDGKNTISRECGLRLQADPSCQPCKRICASLSEFDTDHCAKEVD